MYNVWKDNKDIQLGTYYLLTFHEKNLKNIEVQRQYNRCYPEYNKRCRGCVYEGESLRYLEKKGQPNINLYLIPISEVMRN